MFIIYFILSPEILRNYLKCCSVLLQNKLFIVKKDVKHQTGFEPKFTHATKMIKILFT